MGGVVDNSADKPYLVQYCERDACQVCLDDWSQLSSKLEAGCADDGAEGTARGFFASPPEQIIMCANRLRSQREVHEVLVHEMIHAVDYCARDMDLTHCEQLACPI